jgi:hypothetical protein
MDQIKAGPLKPLKKTETNAHKGDATGFAGALTKKFARARGTSDDDGWDDDDDETTPKQESFGQPRRRFL